MSNAIQAVRGMNDILPDETPLWEFFEDTVRDWLRGYGYRNIRMPILEKTDLFVRSIGEVTDIVEKEMYTFVDRLNNDSLTLRPEGTASCARAVLEHNLLYQGPQRFCYSGPMFRHERPQKGRYRQFHQVGVEALGFTGPDIDAEHIVMNARLWKRLGLADMRLEIGTLGSQQARSRYRLRLIKYLEAHGDRLDADARRRLHANPLRILDSKNPAMQDVIRNAPRLLDDLDEESLKHFEELQAMLRSADVAFEINPRLVRGLDYYNRTVFEWITGRLGAQTCAGDATRLVEQPGGKPAPACGFAMGRSAAGTDAEFKADFTPLQAMFTWCTRAKPRAFSRGRWRNRCDHGIAVVLHCGGGSFKSQMKRADANGASYAIIIGDDEAAAREVSVKPLREAAQQVTVSLAEAIDIFRKR